MTDQIPNDNGSNTQIERVPQTDSAAPSVSDVAADVKLTAKPSHAAPVSVDALSKWIAVALVFVYVTGFLITSLNDFRYGYSDMNPLRPRVLAAGGWFAVFTAVPFTFILELKKYFPWRGKPNNLNKLSELLMAYVGAAFSITLLSFPLFDFDSVPTSHWWNVPGGILVGAVLFAFLSTGLLATRDEFRKRSFKPLQWLYPMWVIGLFVIYASVTFHSLFVKQTFTANATFFWMVLAGIVAYPEIARRERALHARELRVMLFNYFFLMTIFATVYYPHILRKWGGGSPVHIELTLSKDAPMRAGQRVSCSLIDETDSGVYVLGEGDTDATFIPRSEISLIYFGKGNERSTFSPAKEATSR